MSALSDFLTQVAAPWWGVPVGAIIGAGVGGGISHFTTTRNAETAQQAQDLRDAKDQVRAVATRLINEVNALAMTSSGVKQQADGLLEVMDTVAKGGSEEEIKQRVQEKVPGLALSGVGIGGPIGLVINLIRMAGTIEEDIAKLLTILNELQLIGDDQTAEKAVKLTYAALVRKVVGSSAPKELVKASNDAYQASLQDFINAVRAYAGLPEQTVSMNIDSSEVLKSLKLDDLVAKKPESHSGPTPEVPTSS